MLNGEQDKRIKTLLKLGKTQIQDIKNTKLPTDLSLDQQLQTFHNNLPSFYTNKKINVITEDMIRQGLDELPSNADLNKERIKYDPAFQNQKKMEKEEREFERKKHIMPNYLVATLLTEKAEDIKGIDDVQKIKKVNQTLEQL